LPGVAIKHPELNGQADLTKAFDSVDAVVLATEWKEYRELDPNTVSAVASNKLIIDGRNVLDVAKWQQAGFRVLALGRTIQN